MRSLSRGETITTVRSRLREERGLAPMVFAGSRSQELFR